MSVELRRPELVRLLEFGDRCAAVDGPDGLGPGVLAGLAELVGGEAAVWHEIETTGPVRERIVGWPGERFTLRQAERTAAVVGSHPLLKLYDAWRATGRRVPALGRMSAYVPRRQWRASPLFREALSDVDDQMLLMTSVRGPVLQFVSVERGGRPFSEREQALLAASGRQLRAAVHRARAGPYRVLETAPQPRWMLLDPERGRRDLMLLTARQREVLDLVAVGLTDAQIARRLGVSARTVSKHLERVYDALGVSGRVAALVATHRSTGVHTIPAPDITRERLPRRAAAR